MSLSGSSATPPTVREGDSGAAVIQLQQALTALGYDCGGIDGSFGPHVMKAVEAFQAASGLSADGVVGPHTWSALAVAAASGQPPAAPATPPSTGPAGAVYGLGPDASVLTSRTYTGCSTPIEATRTASGAVGAARFTSKLDIDSDGAPGITHAQDPWHQDTTSLKFAGGYVDASTIPYIVLPPSLASASGAKLGDLVQVSYQGKSTYAIFADTGPSTKLGEGSMALANQLGINSDPKNGGLDAQKVQMVILPGSGKAAGIVPGGPAPTFDSLQQAGAQAFANAAQQGLVQ
jgi:peptidoglycan hydrolase-like protein with peptidoglycan-binding domain